MESMQKPWFRHWSNRGLSLLVLFVASTLFPSVCLSNDENLLTSSTLVGPGVIGQSFQAFRYFPMEVRETSRHRNFHPLQWQLGVGYQRSESPALGPDPAIVDSLILGNLGLKWEPIVPLKAGMNLVFASLPEESYGVGLALFEFEYSISIKSDLPPAVRKPSHVSPKKPETSLDDELEDEYDPNDAQQYYRHERKVKTRRRPASALIDDIPDELENDEDYEEDDFIRWRKKRTLPFPQIKLAYHLGLGGHLQQQKTFRRVSLAGVSPSQQSIGQFQNGLDIAYWPKSTARYQLGVYTYLYSGNVTGILSQLEMDSFRRQPLVARSGLSPYTNQLLAFPSWTFDQSAHWALKNGDSFELEFNESLYASSQQPLSYGFSPSYTRVIDKNWRASLSATVILGGISPPLFSGSLGFQRNL